MNALPRYLSKYIHDASTLSRRQIEAAHAAGRVRVHWADGSASSPALSSLVFDDDEVRLDGRVLCLRPPSRYALFHKPAGVLTTVRDPHERPCLAPWLAELGEGVFPVGRLDRATTGALLLSDDGDLAHMLLHPRFHTPKRYIVTLAEALEADDARLAHALEGVDIGRDPPARALAVEWSPASPAVVGLVLDEGRRHVVRKMCRRLRLPLVHLHREAIGALTLGELPCGELRELEGEEVEALWQAVGTRELVRRRQLEALGALARRWRSQGQAHVRLESWLNASGPG